MQLYDADANFFRIRGIYVRAVCFISLLPAHGDSGSVHIYTQTIYSTTQSTKAIHRKHSSLIGIHADRALSLRGITCYLPYN